MFNIVSQLITRMLHADDINNITFFTLFRQQNNDKFFKYYLHKKLILHAMLFKTFLRYLFFTTRKNNAFNVQTIRHIKLFTTCLSRTKNVRESILLRHNMQETLIYLSKKIISSHLVFCHCARHDDKFITRLSFVTRII